ncbi:site-specific integrase [Catenulispora pinisilvae]|uniref:site-specific integrase n=1 Tax=Catenulispora pinisilvae TaxID=2705253 RepID=UPI00189255A4|nr:site-specific integrase [Catenulispora pinisilvae]
MPPTPPRRGPKPQPIPPEIVPFYLHKLTQNTDDGTMRTVVSRLRTMAKFAGGYDALRAMAKERLLEYRSEKTGRRLADKSRGGYEYTLGEWQRFEKGLTRVPHRDVGISDAAALAHPQLEEFGLMIGAGLSTGTVRPYTDAIRMLFEWTFQPRRFPQAYDDPPGFFRGPDGRRTFLAWQGQYAKGLLPGQRGRQLDVNSVAAMQSGVRKWCEIFDVPDLTAGPARVERVPADKTHPISRGQRFDMFAAAADDWADDATAEEGRAWYAFLFLTTVQGMREGSAYAFRPADLDRTGRKSARLTLAESKGYERRAPQVVRGLPAVCDFFSAYYEDPNERALAALGGKDGAQLGAHFRRWAERHGVRDISPHMLRAFMISEHVELYGDIDATCDLIGHQNINTTRGYARHKDDIGDREDFIPYNDERKEMHTFGALWLPESFAALRTERDAWRGLPVAPIARLRPRTAA